jgi:hypothetical protein
VVTPFIRKSGEQPMTTNLALAEGSLAPPPAITMRSLQAFSTCSSSYTTPDGYMKRVIQAARWSEQAGCAGMLIYTDNSLVDPWLVAQVIIHNTCFQCPLVARSRFVALQPKPSGVVQGTQECGLHRRTV